MEAIESGTAYYQARSSATSCRRSSCTTPSPRGRRFQHRRCRRARHRQDGRTANFTFSATSRWRAPMRSSPTGKASSAKRAGEARPVGPKAAPKPRPPWTWALSIQRGAARVGFDWKKDAEGVLDKVAEEAGSCRPRTARCAARRSSGTCSSHWSTCPDTLRLNPRTPCAAALGASTSASSSRRRRFRIQGSDVRQMTPEEFDRLWEEAKQAHCFLAGYDRGEAAATATGRVTSLRYGKTATKKLVGPPGT